MDLHSKISNVKGAFSSTRSRIVIISLVVLAILAIVIGYFRFTHLHNPPAGLGSAASGVPNISSIPGMGQPTREYAKLQEQQNADLAAEAARKGTSAIPTPVRTTYIDADVSDDLSQQTGATSVAGCGAEELKRARAAGVTASELRCRGCSLAALKAAGFSAAELKDAGYSAKELKDAGFSAAELKDAGFSAKDLAQAGFNAKELAAAGYTAGELKDAGFSAEALKNAGFSDKDLAAEDGKGEDCEKKLRQHGKKGLDAAKWKALGCSAAALRAAGYTAAELKAAGFNAADLKKAGFSAADLKKAGFSAKDLRAAGFGAKELKDAGFSAAELKDAGFSAGELKNAGFSAADLKKAGFSAADLKKAGFSAKDLSDAGFSADDLRAAGYTPGDLIRAGIDTAPAKSDDDCSHDDLIQAKKQGISIADLKKRGCTDKELADAGFDIKKESDTKMRTIEPPVVHVVKPLKTASNACDIKNLTKAHAEGVSAAKLKARGCSAADLKAVGYSAKDLYNAGFSPQELRKAGFTNREIQAAKLLHNVLNSDGKADDSDSSCLQPAHIDNNANLVRQQQALIMNQYNQMLPSWLNFPTQQHVAGEAPKVPKAAELNAATHGGIDLKNNDVYKAGNIIFAVLNTEVNSDEVSPVKATIVQGPLKGAMVLGNFQRMDKKLLIEFKVLNVSYLSTSVNVNAVAIDPNTDRTTLSSSVDNHYLSRYGLFLGSAFIQGLGNAYQQSGASMNTGTAGSVFSTMPVLSGGQKVVVALGTTAQQLGSQIGNVINRPPTVKLKAGTSIGLLLMADLVVPKNKKQG